ncbi:3-keto-disaccharide hydrolase [Thalassoroseus pseudoceratinae]|uniref:3-keto-disaccharide hydrolase n=1 Tax=Thalassoroseus pseudoceratinae TaxID=2713176 RepID=UPI001422DDF1|nr:DUF1080 domain-containing protein [Thalassoroseus pseudoceratinae]
MRTFWKLSVWAVVAIACGSFGAVYAEDKAADEDGWIDLFNGKDLTGWKISENGKWKVEDGKIVVSGERSHLFTKRQFKDFELKAEVMTTPGSNSGIYFHTKFQESGWPELGHEAQVNCTHKDPVKTGSLYNVEKNFKCPHEDNKWFTYDIKVEGQQITLKVDGKTIVDYTEPTDIKGGRKLSSGSIALQAHDPGSVVYYRSIKIRPLNESK